MKQIKITSPEDFKQKLLEEFLPTIQAYNQGVRISYNFVHEYICEITLAINPFQQAVYSVYKNAETGYAEYCEGKIGKGVARSIN